MPLDASDVTLILDEVERLSTHDIQPRAMPWERMMDAPTFHQLMGCVEELGLFPDVPHEDTAGLWSDLGDPYTVRLSLGILRALARGNAAVALAAHRRALAQWVLTTCGSAPEVTALIPIDKLAFAATGHYGLARESLGAWLAQRPMSPDDARMLDDWLDRTHASQIWASPAWQGLLWPCWHDGLVQWCVQSRTSLVVQRDAHPHGLGELDIGAVCSAAAIQGDAMHPDVLWRSNLDADASRQMMSAVLKMEFMAAMAMGLGVQDRGAALAREFAGIRRQGGNVIERHPAVQEMLCDIATTQHQLQGLLAALDRPLDDIALSDIAATRKVTSDALIHASHQVIQVHGGVGYMRDAGPEKLVREQHMLRLMAGGVAALPLLLSGLQRSQA